jgi:hypothetical protein
MRHIKGTVNKQGGFLFPQQTHPLLDEKNEEGLQGQKNHFHKRWNSPM